ncbi:hypothetical protein [Marinilabilia salmonicolor]|nr:hypothetical protein [Marinilabilia salmonicolor]
MSKMELLITDESKKCEIAEYVFERLYTRFLKIFDFESDQKAEYEKFGDKSNRKVFEEEYKNGFIQLAACSLLIETFAAYLSGEDETPRGKSQNRFKKVFQYAEAKENDLQTFKDNNHFYERIRCGLLHQGETKGKYTITRKGFKLLYNEKIDAYLFHKSLKELLKSYKKDLCTKKWDDELWDACRQKIRHTINNSK